MSPYARCYPLNTGRARQNANFNNRSRVYNNCIYKFRSGDDTTRRAKINILIVHVINNANNIGITIFTPLLCIIHVQIRILGFA